MKDKENKNSLDSYVKYSGLVVQMGVIIGLGSYIGIKLDEKYKLERPWFALTLSLFSVLLALYVGLKDFFKKSDQ